MINSNIEQHMMYKIGNTPIRRYPYPHFYLENVFPKDFYGEILDHLPPLDVYRPHEPSPGQPKKSRYSIPLSKLELDRFDPQDRDFWRDFVVCLQSEQFVTFVLQTFASSVRKRFKESLEMMSFYPEFRLFRDFTDYSVGPHSDHPNKVAVLIFYLPATADRPHLGTSVYVPKDPAFRCAGGPHYSLDRFTRVATMGYKPNSVFSFFKSSISFHGVEPVTESDAQRDLIQFSIWHRKGGR